jgi:hypothetical protein
MEVRSLTCSLYVTALVLYGNALSAQSRRELFVREVPTGTTAIRRPVWRGVGTPENVVRLSLDGHALGRVVTGSDGLWSFVTPSSLPLGFHTAGIWIEGTDPLASPPYIFTLGSCESNPQCGGATPTCDSATHSCRECETETDCPYPHPVCVHHGSAAGMCAATAPDLTEPVPGSFFTNSSTVRGVTQPNETVALLIDGREISQCTANHHGYIECEITMTLQGWHTLTLATLTEGFVTTVGEGSRVFVLERLSTSSVFANELTHKIRK